MMYSAGRLGDFITQGVSTVAGPFQSFGGAVDIIVVEQEDGSFRSTPWYVKFGKVFGVIKRTEKKVEVTVNDVEANFHMYLNSSGRAYFLTESESSQGDNSGKGIVIIKDGEDVANRFEGNSTDASYEVSNLNDGFVISSERKLAKKRLRQLKAVIGLIFRGNTRKFLDRRHVSSGRKTLQKVSDKIALIEMAEMTAELLERKWCTGYPKGMRPNQYKFDDANLAGNKDDPQIQYRETHAELMERKWFTGYPKGLKLKRKISHNAKLGDDRDDPHIQNMETQTNTSEVVFVSIDDDVVKTSIYSLGRGKRKNEENSSSYMDQPHKSRIRETENTHLTSTENRSNLDQFSGFGSKLDKVQIPCVCVPDRQESTITRHNSEPMSDAGNQTLNAESTGKSISYYKFLLSKEMGATSAVEAVDCVDESVEELNRSGTAESEGADAAEHLKANEHKRLLGRHKLQMNAPTSEQLSSLNLKKGQNLITFTFYSSVFGKQQVDARIYLWKWNSRIVVSDVDGTITKSDVLGHFMPLVGKDWSHLGVARLFSAIKDNGYQFLFLSARAISQAYVTRHFLLNLKQAGETLPDGPILISPDGLFPSLYREVIRRAPHEFKIGCLKDIQGLFPANSNPFYAGFGNRETDEISYLKVGIPKGKIFTINPKGEVVVNRLVDSKSYTSLHKLVNDMFPSMPSSEHEDFNSWNYWKMPLQRIEDKM